MAPRILSKKAQTRSKNSGIKFTLDCQQMVSDKVLVASDFEDFLKKRIKISGKTGNLGEDVHVKNEGGKIVLTSDIPFSKRYLKYLTKKYLKKQQLRDYLHVIATDKNTYQLKYFSIKNDDLDEE